MEELKDRVAVITGGASGIGLGIARSCVEAGMSVALFDVEQAALDQASQDFATRGKKVKTVQVDVSDRVAMEAAAEETLAAFGNVHVLCNNAGVGVGGSVLELSYDDWDWVLDVNLHGTINGIKAFVNHMCSHGEGGHIVNTASMAGQHPIRGVAPYVAAKYGVVGLSETMRLELAPEKIGVTVLCPGMIATNIFTCERNRPERLRSTTEDPGRVQPKPDEQLERLLENVMEPDVVGDMVVHAVRTDEPYIFTHPSFKEITDLRFKAINESYERWAAYRDSLGIQ